MKDLLEYNPIIAAVKNDKGLHEAVKSDCEIIFLLYGDMITLKEKVDFLNKNNKKVFVHLDMITGFASNPIIIDYIASSMHVEGVISTRVNMIKRAIDKNIKAVQRFFIVDSMSLDSALESLKKVRPQAVEIMPGIMPKVIKKVNSQLKIPVISGGLVETKEEVISILKNGASSISTTNPNIWEE
ncbi:glycerol-3-phosphate responsive antiterminator [Tepidibacter hydrothermalis]|uniref:Glycerol-3-phosphate responsive antiterminator n=1 Tax=Tepidibacter hydrothermalis TaxID=3036126 RepID=A0ABY8EDN1_9FIRM|nr:glycerol-3-phosphate responsive antiterminator [Tepidibacter hydrothermalis]WFD10000.1 glycerol-3-phosphate responsive antiterminator [Tepidibacter hydrothermalis]